MRINILKFGMGVRFLLTVNCRMAGQEGLRRGGMPLKADAGQQEALKADAGQEEAVMEG